MSNIPTFNLVWAVNGITTVSDNYFEVGYPGVSPDPLTVSVRSNALDQKTYNSIINAKLYLTGDPTSIQVVQELWPGLGNSFYPTRDELNGGLDISFDGGKNYLRFNTTYGYEKDPSTWVLIPASAIGLSGQDGVLTSVDVATMLVKYTVPSGAIDFKKLNISIGLDFDII